MTLHRLTINVPDDTKGALDALKKDQGVSYTDHVRRAVGLFNHVRRLQQNGETLLVREKDGSYRKIEIIL